MAVRIELSAPTLAFLFPHKLTTLTPFIATASVARSALTFALTSTSRELSQRDRPTRSVVKSLGSPLRSTPLRRQEQRQRPVPPSFSSSRAERPATFQKLRSSHQILSVSQLPFNRRKIAPSMLTFSSLVSTFLALSPQWSSANPIQTADEYNLDQIPIEEFHNVTLVERSCQHPCGWSGQLCCEAAGACYTDSNNQAQCGAATAAGDSGSWRYWTSTWVETDTVTRTEIYSTYIGGGGATVTAQATGTGIACNTDQGESSCGNICCTSEQYCQLSGQCAALGVTNSPGVSATGTGASYSAPVRPTSGTLITITATASASTTIPFETPVATGATAPVSAGESGGGGGLSGGAIAGIVIGVLAGILLLALLCLFCCAKAAFDGILAIFGLGKKKRRSTEYVEEYHRHSHGGGSRHSGWYGDRPARPPPPKKSGLGLGGLLAGLGAAGALFGMKKRHDDRYDDKTTTTDVSSYYYSDYTSSSKSRDHRDHF